MNKEEILTFLKEKDIPFICTEHPAVYTIEEMMQIEKDFPAPETIAKNLFVRDDKKRNYYLITIQKEKTLNLKEFQQNQGTRRLSFASEADLLNILGLTKGSVTPFGLLNDTEKIAHYYLDQDLTEEDISIHPNTNTATVKLKTSDLIRLLEEDGHPVNIVKM